MSKLVWDNSAERLYETGVSKGVLFPMEEGAYGKGVVWNGLTAVTDSPSGAEANALYADNIKYLNLISAEDLGFTIEAYSSPEEFDACDGTKTLAKGVSVGQQTRVKFGFSYQTLIGDSDKGTDHGYKIHIYYGCNAQPSEKAYNTVNDSPEAMSLSWTCTTTPEAIGDGFKPAASIVIDSTKVDKSKLAAFEKTLYGNTDAEAKLPTPAEVLAAFSN